MMQRIITSVTSFALILILSFSSFAPSFALVARAQVSDAGAIVPDYNPALDATRAPTSFGTGQVWHVGPTEQYKKPSDVVSLVHDGDVVEIDAATYACDTS